MADKKTRERTEPRDPKGKVIDNPENTVELTPGVPCEITGINFREAGKIYYFAPCGIELKVGDRVIVSKYAGTEVKIDGEDYFILRQSDVLAIVE